MADETTAEENPDDIMDDWAAALAEQEVADAPTDSASTAQAADIFQRFDAPSAGANTPNNIDMILDIPVNLTVELIVPVALEQGSKFAIREGGLTVGAGVVTKISE